MYDLIAHWATEDNVFKQQSINGNNNSISNNSSEDLYALVQIPITFKQKMDSIKFSKISRNK